MASGWNSIAGFAKSKTPEENQEAMGITQFDPADEARWFQLIGGLIVQGGLCGIGPVLFPAPNNKQTLFVSINGGIATAITLEGFTSDAAGLWFAVGL